MANAIPIHSDIKPDTKRPRTTSTPLPAPPPAAPEADIKPVTGLQKNQVRMPNGTVRTDH